MKFFYFPNAYFAPLFVVTLAFAQQLPIEVFESTEITLRLSKSYYFSLLPGDIRQLLDKYESLPGNREQIDEAFKNNDSDTIEFLMPFIKGNHYREYELERNFYAHAFKPGNIHLAKLFLSYQKDPNEFMCWGHYPLPRAIEQGDPTIVELLLDAGAIPDARRIGLREWLNYYPLATAAKSGNVAIVQMLLDRGARPQWVPGFNRAIWYAVKGGHVEIVRLLLDAGDDYNMLITTGYFDGNALDVAQKEGHAQVATLLKTYGAKTQEGLASDKTIVRTAWEMVNQ